MILKQFLTRYIQVLVVVLLLTLSISSFIIFYTDNLHYFGLLDSIPRLNAARKIIDSLTPGIGQFGSVWLPLPIILTLPLIWNNYLWHSGIAGSIGSMLFYVIGGIYVFKLLKLLVEDTMTSLLGTAVYATNINLLFFQAAPMSESIFISTMIASIYYLILWNSQTTLINLFKCSIFLILITLTRYEGFLILLVAVLFVIYHSYKKEKINKKPGFCEATSLLFIVLSSYGIILWSLYLWVIFKDPLLWLHEYVNHTSAIASTKGLAINHFSNSKTITQPQLSYFQILKYYFFADIVVNGTITSIIGFVTIPFLFIRSKYRSNMLQILPFFIFLIIFMIAMKYAPDLHGQGFFDSLFSKMQQQRITDVNMRFGLALLPFLAVFFAYSVSKNTFLKTIGVMILLIQIGLSFFTNFSLYYSFPSVFHYKHDQNALYFKKIYDGGLILMSDSTNQYFLFDSGLNYHQFIHEGTQSYWKKSLVSPTLYATWIIYDQNNPYDQVRNYLQNITTINKTYDLVYEKNGFKIYKSKSKIVSQVE